MKEAMWGVLIVILGLLGVVIIQVFQNITVTNDQTYYLLKETTEAAMYDAIDLGYYRTKGKVRIVEDKFVENLARRFAESATLNRDYNIVVHDIVEEPPKISISIGTYVFSLQGSKFNIGQSIDAIIEAKYPKEEGEGGGGTVVIPPTTIEGECPVCIPGEDPNCEAIKQCIIGDLRFVGWSEVNVPEKICKGDPTSSKQIDALYQSCDCGKWVDKKDTLTTNPIDKTDRVEYKWNFSKSSTVRTIEASTTRKTYYDICTEDIDLEDEEALIQCPGGKITIVKGDTHRITPTYKPENAVNRDLTWTSSDTKVATVTDSTVPIGPTGIDYGMVTGIDVGNSIITARTTNNKSDTCNVEVINESWECPTTPVEILINNTGQATLKDNFIVPGMKWSIDNPSIATIDENTGLIITGSNAANISYTVSTPDYGVITCPLNIVENKGCTVGTISAGWSKSSLPTLCPQDIDLNSSTYNSAIGITASPRFCGKDGNFDSCDDGKWVSGKSQTFYNPSSRDATDNTPGQAVTLNRTNSSYSITWSLIYRYGEWARKCFNCTYMRDRNQVTTSKTLTGKLLDKNNPSCQNIEPGNMDSNVVIANCPSSIQGDVVSGMTGSVPLYADYTPPGYFIVTGTNPIEWELSGLGAISKTTGNQITYTPPRNIEKNADGSYKSATITMTIIEVRRDSKGNIIYRGANPVTFKNTISCSFNLVPFDDCSEFSIGTYNNGTFCVGSTKMYNLRYLDGKSFNANAFWKISSYVNPVSPSSFGSPSESITLTGIAAGTFTILAEKQVGSSSNCPIGQTATLPVTVINGVASCPNEYFPNLAFNKYCYTNNQYATASPTGCTSGYTFKDKKCYSTKAAIRSREPNVCPSGTYYYQIGGRGYCGDRVSRTCPSGYYTYSESTEGKECRKQTRAAVYEYKSKICPIGSKAEDDGLCYVNGTQRTIKRVCPSGYYAYTGGLDCRKMISSAQYSYKTDTCLSGYPTKYNEYCYKYKSNMVYSYYCSEIESEDYLYDLQGTTCIQKNATVLPSAYICTGNYKYINGTCRSAIDATYTCS